MNSESDEHYAKMKDEETETDIFPLRP